MIAFIDDHREAHGVEPICKVLPIAPSTYHAHVAKRADPAKLSSSGEAGCRPPCGSRLTSPAPEAPKPSKPLRMSVWPAANQDPHTARDRYHRRRLAFASAVTIADTVDGSAGPLILIRAPVANSISMIPAGTGAGAMGSPSAAVPQSLPPQKEGGDWAVHKAADASETAGSHGSRLLAQPRTQRPQARSQQPIRSSRPRPPSGDVLHVIT